MLKPDYSLIGKRIAQRRKRLGLTQAYVAEASEVTEQYISNIERAISIPSTEVIMRLAAALDTTPDEFLVGTARYPDEEWRPVADSLRSLNKRQLGLVKNFISWVVKQDL